MQDHFGSFVVFYKMQGSGNDFVVLDNRQARVPAEAMADWARAVCRRAFGVGADGLFFLEPAQAGSGADIRWHFYNADGSRAEMCGNASRCAARLAVALDMAGPDLVLATDAGPVQAQVLDNGQVRVRLTKVRDLACGLSLDVDGRTQSLHFADTGVPHAVIFTRDIAAVDVAHVGRNVRFHKHFAPKGTNVNFVQVAGPGAIRLRTYERGVEAETFACGTGAAAALAVARHLDLTGDEVQVTTSGGDVLTVALDAGEVLLTGGAACVFSGRLYLEPQGLALQEAS
jgi:diaminopimelate epimerase